MEKERQLIEAAIKGNLQEVKYLVENGANIYALNDSALKCAVSRGNLQVVKYLVGQGANIHAVDAHALKHAKQKKHYRVVKYLKAIRTTQQYKRIYH